MMAATHALNEANNAQGEGRQLALMEQLVGQIEVAIAAIAANTSEPFVASVELQQQLVQALAACEVPSAALQGTADWKQTSGALLLRMALYAAVLAQAARSGRLLGHFCAWNVSRSALSAHG